MRRGTTPTLKLITEWDWSDYELWVTIEQKDYEATFKDDRLKISESGADVYLELTQAETLAFKKGSAKIQIKGKKDGIVIATDIGSFNINEVLDEEVM